MTDPGRSPRSSARDEFTTAKALTMLAGLLLGATLGFRFGLNYNLLGAGICGLIGAGFGAAVGLGIWY